MNRQKCWIFFCRLNKIFRHFAFLCVQNKRFLSFIIRPRHRTLKPMHQHDSRVWHVKKNSIFCVSLFEIILRLLLLLFRFLRGELWEWEAAKRPKRSNKHVFDAHSYNDTHAEIVNDGHNRRQFKCMKKKKTTRQQQISCWLISIYRFAVLIGFARARLSIRIWCLSLCAFLH